MTFPWPRCFPTYCGYGVPMNDYQMQRPTLSTWDQNKGPEKIAKYQVDKGSTSIDGLITPIGQLNVSDPQ